MTPRSVRCMSAATWPHELGCARHRYTRFNFIRVVADDRQPAAYGELMRVASRSDASEEEALRSNRQLKRLLQNARETLRAAPELGSDVDFWRAWADKLMALVTRPVLLALPPGCAQGSRFDDLVVQALDVFEAALSLDPDPSHAIQHLSDVDAIRILTIHKCKGLEFEHVIILGIENETFWGNPDQAMAEFFVGVSRAKHQLTLIWAKRRTRPEGHSGRRAVIRTAQKTYLDYALDK